MSSQKKHNRMDLFSFEAPISDPTGLNGIYPRWVLRREIKENPDAIIEILVKNGLMKAMGLPISPEEYFNKSK